MRAGDEICKGKELNLGEHRYLNLIKQNEDINTFLEFYFIVQNPTYDILPHFIKWRPDIYKKKKKNIIFRTQIITIIHIECVA